MNTITHINSPIEVECPECEAAPGDDCTQWNGDWEYTLPGFHNTRYTAAEYHTYTTRTIPDSDIIIAVCDECGHEDAL